jgi:flagellar hook-length control protein FliK
MTQPESALSGADRSVVFSRLVSDQTSTRGGFEGLAAKGPAQSISEQISDSLHASLDRGERQVVIRLRPPELGSVLVRFREQNEQIHGVLEVSRSETMRELEQALPQVLRSLQDIGIQIRKFEVTVSEQPEKDPGGQSLHQDAWPQQHGSDRQTSGADRSPGSSWSLGDAEPQDGADYSGSATAATGVPVGRIDMLV